jgi:YHS domain-containing protein
MKLKIKCDWCGAEFERLECQIKGKKHLFCSRKCLADFSNKSKNPDGYSKLKDYTGMSQNMTAINERMNPTRMTMETRTKLRDYHLALPAERTKTYAKRYSRHEHVVVAEEILGRKLRADEVVHHIDENIRNNEPSNLAVMTRSDHSRLRAFWWAKEAKTYDKPITITPLSELLR